MSEGELAVESPVDSAEAAKRLQSFGTVSEPESAMVWAMVSVTAWAVASAVVASEWAAGAQV